jgi:hypothetical protein
MQNELGPRRPPRRRDRRGPEGLDTRARRVAPDLVLIPAPGRNRPPVPDADLLDELAEPAADPIPFRRPGRPRTKPGRRPPRLFDAARRSSLGQVLPLFLVWRLWLQLIYWLPLLQPKGRLARLPTGTYPQLMTDVPYWLSRWLAWDGQHYLRTVVRGYGAGQAAEGGTAIFPLYAMATRALDWLTPLHAGLAGLLVSHACTLVFLVVLYRLGEQIAGEGRGRRAVLLFLVMPTSFFLVAYYAEAMLLALAAVAIEAGMRRRWAVAALAAALASATKPQGILLLPTLVVLWLHIDRRWRQGLWLLLAPTGLGLWMVFLWRRYGDPMVWLNAQSIWGREVGGDALTRLVHGTTKVLSHHPWGWSQLVTTINVVTLVAMLVLAVLLLIDKQPALAVLVAGAVLMPAATGSVLSMCRLALLGFPAVFWLARHLRDRGPAELAIYLGGIGFGTLAFVAFVGGAFVA